MKFNLQHIVLLTYRHYIQSIVLSTYILFLLKSVNEKAEKNNSQ